MEEKIFKQIDGFFKQFKRQVYKKGEILIRVEEDPPGVFYLTSGSVRQYAISKKGEELVVNLFKSAAFFPMSFAINRTPNNYYFEAITDSETYLAPAERAVNFIRNNPEVLFNLMSRVYKGTDGILMKMVYLMSGEAYSRLITELLITARRFGKKEGKKIVLNLSEKDLANQSGMARETVSREIRLLKQKGLVNMNKNVISIANLDNLERELQSNS